MEIVSKFMLKFRGWFNSSVNSEGIAYHQTNNLAAPPGSTSQGNPTFRTQSLSHRTNLISSLYSTYVF